MVANSSDLLFTFGDTTVQAIYAVSSLTSVFIWYAVWRHRSKTGAKLLLVTIAAGWWWTTSLLGATLIDNLAITRFLLRLFFLGVVVVVTGIFVFTLEYTGRSHLVTRKTLALLSIEPIVIVFFAFVNPGDTFYLAFQSSELWATGLEMRFGPVFGLHTLYSYVLILTGSYFILDLVYRTRAMYRGQLVVLVGAVTIPLVPNLLSILQLINFDATPLGFLLTNGLFAVAITRYRLIDLAPIARDQVVNNVSDAMFVVDTDNRIVDLNPAAEELAEEYVGETALVGENAREILELVPDLGSVYDDIVTEERPRTIEYALGGGHYMTDATPIHDTRDQLVGWLFLIRDITERKRREQQLHERNEQLDKFASVVSHDLRNPLQVASGRVEISRDTGDVEHLEAAENALTRMETIIEDVLALARSGQEVTDLKLVPLRSAAESAWENVETDGIALSVDTDARVTADENRLIRLLENLFRNAVEHGMPAPATDGSEAVVQSESPGRMQIREHPEHPEDDATGQSSITGEVGPARLTISLDVIRRDGRAVGFHVSDDGTGIPADEREAVFESGYSGSADGTGFGLTIVSQIAEAHGWHVSADGSDEGGARFEFTGVEVVND